MSVRLWSVVFDANDRVSLARFWADALGWAHTEEEEGVSTVSGGNGTLRRLEFVTNPNEKRSKNRMHFDLSSEGHLATVERLIGLGARHVDIGQGPETHNIVLADPEGNEFCVGVPGDFVDQEGLLGSLTCDGSPSCGYFWSEALGWPLVWDQDEETAIRAPDGTGQFVTWGPPVPPKYGKSRLHIDVAPLRDDDQQTEVERLVSLGATRVDIGQGDVPWVVLADPDGNEFCVLTSR